jgi:hypothetical protein
MGSYNPAAAVEVIPAGTYDAVVTKATDDVSKNGNDMIKLKLTVYTPMPGITVDVWDYLVFSDAVLYKVKHFCESAGIDFAKGVLEGGECVEKNVRVKLAIDSQEGYPDKNVVKDYVKRNGVAPAAASQPKATSDPDVPF